MDMRTEFEDAELYTVAETTGMPLEDVISLSCGAMYFNERVFELITKALDGPSYDPEILAAYHDWCEVTEYYEEGVASIGEMFEATNMFIEFMRLHMPDLIATIEHKLQEQKREEPDSGMSFFEKLIFALGI